MFVAHLLTHFLYKGVKCVGPPTLEVRRVAIGW